MKKGLVFLSIFFLSGCLPDPDITGHWHMRPEVLTDSTYLTLDIINDSIAFMGENMIHEILMGQHNPDNNTLLFPGACGAFRFTYKSRGNKLYLENYLENWVAEKCDTQCCNKIEDFTNEFKLKCDLPQIIKNANKFNIFEKDSNEGFENIMVGFSKKPKNESATTDLKIELDGQISTIDDIGEWVEKRKSRVSEPRRKRMIYRLFADKNVSIEKLLEIKEQIVKQGVSKMVLVSLKKDFEKQNNMFQYVIFDNRFSKTSETLGEVLN